MTDAKPGDEELLERAREGIERRRQADLTVEVVGAGGRPVAGARIALRMARHEFLFGCALFEALADQEARPARAKPLTALDHWDDLRRQAVELFNFATLPFYWGGYEPHPGRTRSAEVARLWDWCAANGMKTKGHPLIWCEAVPDWLPQDRDELDRLIRRRMDDLAADFGPLSARPLDFVDFLNEPTVQPANFDNPLALWMRDLGPDGTAEMAYDRAAAFRPAERGILNHFLRDETYLELARRLIDGGRPIRAIGLQSHQHSGTRPLWMFQEETDRFAALGVPVHWTENSVLSGEARRIRFVKGRADVPPWPSTPEGEARQAEALVQQYTLLFGHPAVEAVTQWNFTDAASWLSAPSGLLDKDLRPKPAYRALHELIRGRWWTDADLVADRRGLARSRVFRGNYRLRVIAPDGAAERELDATVADSAVRLSVDLAGAPPSKRR